MNNIIYSDKNRVEKIIENINNDGENNIYVLADFDRTLTYSLINWEKKPSLISVIRDNPKYLWKDYSNKANSFFNYYHSIEIDSNISIKEKSLKMTEWWNKHLSLLVDSWLNRKHIDSVVNSWIIKMRSWVIKFIDILDKKNIPLIILSANWLGWDSIIDYLKFNNLYSKNVEVISNKFVFDEEGKAVWYNKNVIHVFNKWEVVFHKFPQIEKKIKNKRNIILLWDSLWDPHMADWAHYDNILKIWFYNEDNEKNLEIYMKKYDILLTWDWDGDFLNKILTKKC